MELTVFQLYVVTAATASAAILLIIGFQAGRIRAVEQFQARTEALTERTQQLQQHLTDAERECAALRSDMERVEAERDLLRRRALTDRDGELLHHMAGMLNLAGSTFAGMGSQQVGPARALAKAAAELAERIAPSMERAA